MHGQYIRNMDRQVISEEDTFLWLSKGDLKAETESEIVAAQDQALQTKYYATKILSTRFAQPADKEWYLLVSTFLHRATYFVGSSRLVTAT